MKKIVKKSHSIYEKLSFDVESSKKAQKRINRKMPTSVSLPPQVVKRLKSLAQKKGIPYQVLMRSFIIEGLERLKKSA